MTTYFRVDRINAYSEGDTITLTSPEDIPSDFIQVLNMLAPGGLSPHGLVYCTNPSALAADKSVAIDLSLELFRRSFSPPNRQGINLFLHGTISKMLKPSGRSYYLSSLIV